MKKFSAFEGIIKLTRGGFLVAYTVRVADVAASLHRASPAFQRPRSACIFRQKRCGTNWEMLRWIFSYFSFRFRPSGHTHLLPRYWSFLEASHLSARLNPYIVDEQEVVQTSRRKNSKWCTGSIRYGPKFVWQSPSSPVWFISNTSWAVSTSLLEMWRIISTGGPILYRRIPAWSRWRHWYSNIAPQYVSAKVALHWSESLLTPDTICDCLNFADIPAPGPYKYTVRLQ